MFTGIVEATGTVQTAPVAGAPRLTVATGLPVEALPLGASIAVDGVCLTVVERDKGWFAADLGPETLARTTLAALAAGDRVHLERPLNVGDPLGGHLVAGHVDDVGVIVARQRVGDALELAVAAPPALAAALVAKGSIAIDGVSLTVNTVSAKGLFSVMLIPHTLSVTHLGAKTVGARVNLEGDLLAKHVDRLLSLRLAAATGGVRKADPTTETPSAEGRRAGLSLETLRKHGFAS